MMLWAHRLIIEYQQDSSSKTPRPPLLDLASWQSLSISTFRRFRTRRARRDACSCTRRDEPESWDEGRRQPPGAGNAL